MEESLFRKDSMDRISSPEQLNDYLHVTNPTVWVVLAAVIILLAGTLVWGFFAHIDSFASGTAKVEGGTMTVLFDDEKAASNVEAGMKIIVGESESTVTSVGKTEEGKTFALASTSLSDGTYPARTVFRQTQVLRLLFN